MKYTDLIWDFNGTILDDIAVCVDIESDMLRRRGRPGFASVDEYYAVFCFPVKQYYINMGYDFSVESYDDVAEEWAKEYAVRTVSCGLREGVADMLEKGRANGVGQIILSSSEKNILSDQLVSLGVSGYFKEILALGNSKGESKVDLAVEWFERTKPERALFIGDTAHDAEAAARLGCDCALVCGGHASAQTLASTGYPVYPDIAALCRELYGDE
ncbi:MAG: HAD family hydrolase [Clostridia bacterium]|nr:HAD family hydrolase [Clostridia bacterium]